MLRGVGRSGGRLDIDRKVDDRTGSEFRKDVYYMTKSLVAGWAWASRLGRTRTDDSKNFYE